MNLRRLCLVGGLSALLAVGCTNDTTSDNNGDEQCEQGETRDDGCNECRCLADGTWSCTLVSCPDIMSDADDTKNEDGTDDDADTEEDISSDAVLDGTDPVCALPQPFDVDVQYQRDLFVATDGDDSAAGTRGDELATLEEAARLAEPGTRIFLREGTYTGGTFIGNLQGTADAPIKIVGLGNAVIEGGNTALQLSDPQYLVLEQLEIRGAAQNGLNIDDGGSYESPAHHIVLRQVTVRDIGDGGNQDCIKLSGVDDFWVLDSGASNCSGQGIDMVGCHRGVISRNAVSDKPGAGIQAKGGTADITIHGNRIYDVSGRGVNAGGSTGLEFFRPDDAPYEAANIRVVANVFERVGAESGAPIAFVGCDGCTFANNTVVEPKTWVARILQETTGERFVPSRDGVFVNNIVVFKMADIRSGTFVNVGPDTAPETFTFANNLWYALDDPDFSGPTLSGGIPAPEDSVVADPGFENREGGIYFIGPDSPAAGAGQALTSTHPDYLDRCYGEPPSIGAYVPE